MGSNIFSSISYNFYRLPWKSICRGLFLCHHFSILPFKTRTRKEKKGNVDILTFGSQNNLITAGNNRITFKLRNRNPYDVIVAVRYKYSGEWESDYHTFQVAGNSIRSVETLGKAWNKATDVTIMDVY